MKLRIVSDLHTEFWGPNGPKKMEKLVNQAIPPLDTDGDTTLVLAGDTGSLDRKVHYQWFLDVVSERFKDIVWVAGNHEWYGGNFEHDQKTYLELLDNYSNIHYDYYNVFHGVRFLCMTLWTDYERENPFIMELASQKMNDYSQIGGLTPQVALKEHVISRTILEDYLKNSWDGPTVVVTHHLPTWQSIPVEYKTSKLSGCYASDLEHLMVNYKPDLWIHGHTHTPVDYTIENTRIICNPHGYRGFEKTGYNPKLVLDI